MKKRGELRERKKSDFMCMWECQKYKLNIFVYLSAVTFAAFVPQTTAVAALLNSFFASAC